jgi:hypothetical protein
VILLISTLREWVVFLGEWIGSAIGAFVDGVIEALDDDPWW